MYVWECTRDGDATVEPKHSADSSAMDGDSTRGTVEMIFRSLMMEGMKPLTELCACLRIIFNV